MSNSLKKNIAKAVSLAMLFTGLNGTAAFAHGPAGPGPGPDDRRHHQKIDKNTWQKARGRLSGMYRVLQRYSSGVTHEIDKSVNLVLETIGKNQDRRTAEIALDFANYVVNDDADNSPEAIKYRLKEGRKTAERELAIHILNESRPAGAGPRFKLPDSGPYYK